MVGRGIDQKRLERSKEQARGVAEARGRLAIRADGEAELLKDEVVTGAVVAAQHATLELMDEHSPRRRRQRAEIVRSLDG